MKFICADCEGELSTGRKANLAWIHDCRIEDLAARRVPVRCVPCQEIYEREHGAPPPRISRESFAALSEADDSKAARESGWLVDDMAPVVIPGEAA